MLNHSTISSARQPALLLPASMADASLATEMPSPLMTRRLAGCEVNVNEVTKVAVKLGNHLREM